MSTSTRCRYCGLWTGDVVGMDMPASWTVHGHCHDEAFYKVALAKARALTVLPSPGTAHGRHTWRALRRSGLERLLEVVTKQART